MLFIHLTAVFGLFLFLFCYLLRRKGADVRVIFVLFIFVPALFIRLAAAGLSGGFDNDTACFAAWADRIFRVGPAGFYSADVFTDYPPGYMYLLYPVGALRALLDIPYYSPAHLILLRLPAIFCDLGCGLLLYRQASKKRGEWNPLVLCAAYLFNPAVILNSSVWGQTDSVYTLLLTVMCLSLTAEKLFPAFLSFCLGLLVKPQMLLFSPVLFAGVLDQVFLKDFSANKLCESLTCGVASLLGTFLLIIPFGPENVLSQYVSTVSSYPYAAVNACNFWGLLGLNWVGQDNLFLGLPYRFYGWAAIAAAILFTLFVSLRRRQDREKYSLLAALLMTAVFLFSVRMHERYLYPALFLLLLYCAARPSKRLFLCYGGLSLLHFYNTAYVLFFYDPAEYDRKAPFILLVSAGMLIFFVLLCRAVLLPDTPAGTDSRRRTGHTASPQNGAAGCPSERYAAPRPMSHTAFLQNGAAPRPSAASLPLRRADVLCMLIVTVLYSCFALYDLGDRKAPSTGLELTRGDSLELTFGASVPTALSYYMAPGHKRVFTLEGRQSETESWLFLGEITLQNVFTWQEIPLEESCPQLRLTLESDSARLLELVFTDASGNLCLPDEFTGTAGNLCLPDEFTGTAGNLCLPDELSRQAEIPGQKEPDSRGLLSLPDERQWLSALFDEQALFPRRSTFRDSMYFDEIYHARTAWEFLRGLPAYENTHPPLGKEIISLGIAVFGMNPFGWRIMGTLFGIAMVSLTYLFAKRLTASSPPAALACVLYAFDFMHFTQTRIATIDVYISFFVLLMYLAMYRYSCLSFYDTPLVKTFLPLGACGLFMGLGIACKWTGVYAGAGLAVLFFGVLFRRYREYLYAKQTPEGCTSGIPHSAILTKFKPDATRTILFCILTFVLVPALIYLLSYIPFSDGTEDGLLLQMLHNQESMFRYHSSLDAVHPYSSPWYEWPIIRRPIWYFSGVVTGAAGAGGIREGISAFGNPLVWWAGIPAALYMLILTIQKKDRTAAFLLTGYLAQYLPWFFVTRITFIYHYFPSVIFVVLMIVHGIAQWKKRLGRRRFAALLILYGASVVGLFLLFYPVLSGQPVDSAFVDRFLRWFDTWVLTLR